MKGCVQWIVNSIITIAIIALALALVLYFYLIPNLEVQLADGLKRKLELPASATVDVDTSDIVALFQGKVNKVSVLASEAKLGSVVINNLNLDAYDLTFDLLQTIMTKSLVADSIAGGNLSFDVHEKSLEDAWITRAEKYMMSDVNVQLNPLPEESLLTGKLGGEIELLGKHDISIKFEAAGIYTMNLQKQSISYEFKSLSIEGFALPEGLVQNVLTQFQPRIELNRFKFPFELDSITVGTGKILVKGKAKRLDLTSNDGLKIEIPEESPEAKPKSQMKEEKVERKTIK